MSEKWTCRINDDNEKLHCYKFQRSIRFNCVIDPHKHSSTINVDQEQPIFLSYGACIRLASLIAAEKDIVSGKYK